MKPLLNRSSSLRERLQQGFAATCEYDEVLDAVGAVRSQWEPLLASLGELGDEELGRRWEQARRIIRENGVTYNVHGDSEGLSRPWELDPLPLVLPSDVWTKLSEGLSQRARLLNLVLADIYGPQRLLKEGLLPPELVYANPGFLRPCHGVQPTGGRYLYFYAAHLARDARGDWVVIADRARGPTGAGYAIENRIVTSRMLPEMFRQMQVERIARFFLTLRETLESASTRDNPRIVLLSPGPTSPTYFEDAYLARYLGFGLVEGGDLTVRDDTVWLKTLGGLLKVDVILRRLRDEECDPLELQSDSFFGVPGLTQAARTGNVVLANALGCSLVESPALVPFLPTLARSLLGEELLLPTVRTWWCGDGESLRYVAQHLDELVLKPCYPDGRVKPVYGASLSREERAQWRDRLQASPQSFVAQELIPGSTAPHWNSGDPTPCRVAVRTFAVARGDSYDVMPGGLARVSMSADAPGESALGGQGSKDVWVLASGPVSQVSLLHPAGASIALQPSGNDLPSRVADHLFWLGRQAERIEGAVRMTRSIVARLSGETSLAAPETLATLLRGLADHGRLTPGTAAASSDVIEEDIFSFLVDPQRPGGLQAMLQALRRTATVVRDRLSIDSWRILNHVAPQRGWDFSRMGTSLGDTLPLLDRLVLDLAGFSGMGNESMTRGPGWRFLDMGRRVERALHTLRLLSSTLVFPATEEEPVYEALLEIADSSMTYRNRYLTTLQLPPLLDLLVTDLSNPRAVAFQAEALAGHIDALPRASQRHQLSSEQRAILAMQTDLRLVNVYELAEIQNGQRALLDQFLQRCSQSIRELSDEVVRNYLVHAGPARQMPDVRPTGFSL